MTTYAFPFSVDQFTMQSRAFALASRSIYGGNTQVSDMLNDRWLISLSIPLRASADGAAVEAWINKMRGLVNTAELWHMARPVPRGTMRGSPTCGTTAKGASSLTLTTSAGATLEAGDMIGIGGRLYQVASYAQADGGGTMSVTIVNRTRAAITTGSAVTWDKPKVQFQMVGFNQVPYLPGYSGAVNLDFEEYIA